MVDRHRDYSALREAHANALEALNNHIEKGPSQDAGAGRAPEISQEVQQGHEVTVEAGPTRPEGHYGDRATSSDRGDMPSQQRAANNMHEKVNEYANERHAESRQQRHEQSLAALNEHASNPNKERDQVQEPQIEPNRDNEIER